MAQAQISIHGLIRPPDAARSVSDMNPSPLLTAHGLLHALSGILVPDGGRVTYATPAGGIEVGALGQEARTRLRRTEFGVVFQSGQLLDELTARENVALPLLVDGCPRRSPRR